MYDCKQIVFIIVIIFAIQNNNKIQQQLTQLANNMPIQKDLTSFIQCELKKNQPITNLIIPKQRITTINKLQKSIAQNIRVIDLSQNMISSLQGIQQFVNLQQLNVTKNKIKTCSQFLRLKNLTKIQKLFLTSNSFLNQPLDQQFVEFVSELHTDLQIFKQKSVRQKSSKLYQSSMGSDYNKKSLVNSNLSKKVSNNVSQQKFKQYQRLGNQTRKSISRQQKTNQYIEEKQSSLELSSQQLKNQILFKQNQPNHKLNQIYGQPKPFLLKRNYSKNQQENESSLIDTIRKRQLSSNLIGNKICSKSKSKQEQFFQTVSNREASAKKNSKQNKINTLTMQKRGDSPSGLKILSSSRKNVQLEVDNLMINIDSQDVNLNYGSIIEKQQDQSYQLQFDFFNRSKKQLKYDQNMPGTNIKVNSNIKEVKKKESNKQYKKIPKQIQQIKLVIQNQQMQTNSELIQNTYHSPTFLAVTPQFIGQSYDFTVNNNLTNESLFNQNIQNSYYKHLISVNPSLTLLYSSIPSLNASQKNILLQILFKNHKQLYIQLAKQHLYKEKTKSNLNQKSFHLDSLAKNHHELQNKINQLKFTQEKHIRIIQLLTAQKKQILSNRQDLKKALKSRQKIIEDIQIEYKKLKKQHDKLEKKHELQMNQDEKQQTIIQKRNQLLKKLHLAKWLQQYNNNLKIQKAQDKRSQKWVLSSWSALKKYQLINLYIKMKQKFKLQKTIKQAFNDVKIHTNISKKQKLLIKLLDKCYKKQTFSVFLRCKQLGQNKRNKQIRADKYFQKKFYKKWELNSNKKVKQRNQRSQLAISKTKIKILKKYFSNLCQLVKITKGCQLKVKQKLTGLRIQFSYNRFLNNINSIYKNRQIKATKISNYIQIHNFLLFGSFIKKRKSIKQLKQQQLKKRCMRNLKRYFNSFKKACSKGFTIKKNTANFINKVTQNLRIEDLIIQFKMNLILQNFTCEKKKSLVFQLRNNLIKNKQKRIKMQVFKKYRAKKFEVKWKWTIFNVLCKNMVMRKYNKSLQKYEIQSQLNKINFEQTQLMNEKTILTLKDEVKLYSSELIFHKSQIQMLSQREMFILSQKQECLLELRERQSLVQQLQTRLSLQSMQKCQLSKKYDKILDLYAQTVEQYEHKNKKSQQFLYDTINQGDMTARTLRKQVKKSLSPVRDFCSLKNKYENNI